MPRKSTSKAASTPKAEETPSRRSGLRAPAAKQPAKEPATPTSEPKRSRRSSTAAQTAASQADSRKPRGQSPGQKSSSGDETSEKGSPASRATRRPMKKVNYEESDGEEENAEKPVGKEEDYNAEEDVENDSDSLESTSKKKGKLKTSPTPPKTTNSRGRSQNSRSPKSSRSHKKKVVEPEDDGEDESKATPSRRGRHSSEKVDNQEDDEKPKGTSRSRRAVAAASPASSRPARPSRSARQRKSTASEEKAETPKPVRSSTRNRRKVKQQEDENEDMEEDAEQKEEDEDDEQEKTDVKDEKEESKKRKLEVAEDEKDEEERKVKKAKIDDNETPNELTHSDEDEDKKEEEPAEKEEESEEPMEVDSKDESETDINKKSVSTDEKVVEDKIDEPENESTSLEKKEETNEVVDAPDEAGDSTKAKSEVEAAKEEEDDDEEEEEYEEEEEEEEEEEADEELQEKEDEKDCKKPVEDEVISDKGSEVSKSSEDPASPKNQNSPVVKHSPVKQSNPSPAANADVTGEGTVTEEPKNSLPVLSDSPKATNCESFQSSPVRSQDNVNGTSPPEDLAKTKSEPTQMLPSSAIELNQQQLTPAKPEPDVIRISANGHVADGKSSVDVTANDCSSGLLRGRLYQTNRSSCAEVLSRFRDRTFGLVSFNLESTKVDDEFCLELRSVVGDVVCIQGINQELYSDQIEPSLNALGYKGTLAQDENRGVATFYRSSLFQLKGQKKLTFKQIIAKNLERGLAPGEVAVVAEKFPVGGQIIFTHLGLTQSTRGLVVANVLVPPSDVTIQALQMSCLAREAVAFVECGGTSGGVPLVFCGTFNIEQQEAAYQLLRDGHLSNEMVETLQNKKDLKLPGRDEDTSLINLLWKSFQHPTAGLKSCYSAVTGQEMVVGGQGSVKTSPDLIWFSSDSLTPIGVLEAPSNPTGHHLLLKTNLAFNY